MAATSTTVDGIVLTVNLSPLKVRLVTVLGTFKEKVNYWWREGRKGGTLQS